MHMEDENAILPQGESLRAYLVQPFVSKGDLKNLLRLRGVFTSQQDKEQTIPALTLSLIKPTEFVELQQLYTAKEDNPKITTQIIEWAGTETLIDSIPENIDVNKVLDLDFENFKVINAPSFFPVAGKVDAIRMDFEIERLDRSKSWADSRKRFTASIEIQKNNSQDELIIISTHTAPETKQTNRAVTQFLINQFKEKGQIGKKAKVRRIRFCDFTNVNRFDYLLGLTRYSKFATVSFEEVVDIGLVPDEEHTLPDELEWMEERIRGLDLHGTSLEDSEFLSNPNYRPSLLIHRLDAKFRFSLSAMDGHCVISLAFTDFNNGHNRESEIELRIKKIEFDEARRGLDKNEAKQTILKELEFEKIEMFKRLAKVDEAA
ncbi:GapS4b family protein [Pseudomonas soli]|uniref:GapS4b family protein n=1 Tax=Pseudomonas soli TaxID=1306993 RepID=UPI003DA9801A